MLMRALKSIWNQCLAPCGTFIKNRAKPCFKSWYAFADMSYNSKHPFAISPKLNFIQHSQPYSFMRGIRKDALLCFAGYSAPKDNRTQQDIDEDIACEEFIEKGGCGLFLVLQNYKVLRILNPINLLNFSHCFIKNVYFGSIDALDRFRLGKSSNFAPVNSSLPAVIFKIIGAAFDCILSPIRCILKLMSEITNAFSLDLPIYLLILCYVCCCKPFLTAIHNRHVENLEQDPKMRSFISEEFSQHSNQPSVVAQPQPAQDLDQGDAKLHLVEDNKSDEKPIATPRSKNTPSPRSHSLVPSASPRPGNSPQRRREAIARRSQAQPFAAVVAEQLKVSIFGGGKSTVYEANEAAGAVPQSPRSKQHVVHIRINSGMETPRITHSTVTQTPAVPPLTLAAASHLSVPGTIDSPPSSASNTGLFSTLHPARQSTSSPTPRSPRSSSPRGGVKAAHSP